jgi:cyanophycinase-like exopeptidase
MRWHLWLASLAIAACLGEAISAAQPADLVGTWDTLDWHAAMGSLYQPVNGARNREGVVHFRLEEGRLKGCAICADHGAITRQERWTHGRTDFRRVEFAGDKLTIEWDFAEWFPAAAPLAVREKKIENKGSARVEAVLRGDRLVGTWKLLLADGTEVFRGEWEAVRSKAPLWPAGKFLLIGGRHQDLTAEVRDKFFELAGGREARIVGIPTAVASPETDATPLYRQPWLELGARSVEILHTRDKAVANDPAFAKPLTTATAVFITNGHRHRIFDAYRGTLVEKELKNLAARGGLIAGTGTGAVVLGELSLMRPVEEQATEPGLGIVPKFLIEDRADDERFPVAISAHRAIVGLLLAPTAAVVIEGQSLVAMGDGQATVRLAEAGEMAGKVIELKPGKRQDLLELLLEASARGEATE